MEPLIRRRGKLFICLTLCLAIAAVYGQILDYPFIKFDEEQYVTKNPHVQSGLSWEGIAWGFGTFDTGFWQPLTWLSHMLDCQMYGLKAGGHHLTNLSFHLINTLLLFLFFNRVTGALWKSGFVAALFALHPLHVESVAWVADRKDLLSALFWLLTMIAYVSYTKHPGIGRYLLVLLLFFLGLMAKPMMMTLPFILLGLDVWPLERFRSGQDRPNGADGNMGAGTGKRALGKEPAFKRMILEKIPMIVLAVPIGLITIVAEQNAGAFVTIESFPLDLRIANALISYVRYIGKMFWPFDLAIFYPHPIFWPLWQVTASGVLLLFLSYGILRGSKRYPYLGLGWLWYLGSLVPVIGFFQVGSFSIADRYTYVPLIGLFIIIAWGIPDLSKNWHHQMRFLFPSSVVLLFLLMIISSKQVRHWENTITLFTHAIEVTENNYLAHGNLAAALMEQGQMERAYEHNREALKIIPHHFLFNLNMGEIYAMQGKMDQAIFHFRRALQSGPNKPAVHRDLADTLMRKGIPEEAIPHYQWLLERTRDNPELHNNLAVALALSGKVNEAVTHLQIALRLKPGYAEAEDNLSKLLKKSQSAKAPE